MTSTTKARPLFDPPIVQRAIVDSFKKLDPRRQVRNPVMFTVYVGSILTTALGVHAIATHSGETFNLLSSAQLNLLSYSPNTHFDGLYLFSLYVLVVKYMT